MQFLYMDLWITYSSLSSSASFSISLTTSSSVYQHHFCCSKASNLHTQKNPIKTPTTPDTALSSSSSHHDLLVNTPTRVWLRDWWLFESCNAIPLQRLVDYLQLFIIIILIILNILNNIIIIISASFVPFQSIQPPDTKNKK